MSKNIPPQFYRVLVDVTPLKKTLDEAFDQATIT